MKAVRLHARGGTEQLVYEEAPKPAPGPGDALVRVHACAITPTERSWAVVKKGGILVIVADSVPAGKAEQYGIRAVEFIVEPSRSQLVEIARLIDGGELRPIIAATFPLSQTRQAFERGLEGHSRGKIVLEVRSSG